MLKRYLGIDLGGCMSGTSAYCLIEGDGKSFTILDLVKEPKHKSHQACRDFIKEHLLVSGAVRIGIDAPLTLPRKLYDPAFKPRPRDAGGEIDNPYLYRYCDYYLFKTFGLRPMPPAGDRIGRLTARMIELLQDDALSNIKERIIEIYPKQIALELGLQAYKKNPQSVLERLGCEAADLDEHQIDALLAAYATMMIDHGHTVDVQDRDEGWCYPLRLKNNEGL